MNFLTMLWTRAIVAVVGIIFALICMLAGIGAYSIAVNYEPMRTFFGAINGVL